MTPDAKGIGLTALNNIPKHTRVITVPLSHTLHAKSLANLETMLAQHVGRNTSSPITKWTMYRDAITAPSHQHDKYATPLECFPKAFVDPFLSQYRAMPQTDAFWFESSRSFEVEGFGFIFAPCVDMVNHNTLMQNAKVHVQVQDGIVTVELTRDVTAGQEILIDYGFTSPYYSALYYDFVNESDYEKIPVRVKFDSDDGEDCHGAKEFYVHVGSGDVSTLLLQCVVRKIQRIFPNKKKREDLMGALSSIQRVFLKEHIPNTYFPPVVMDKGPPCHMYANGTFIALVHRASTFVRSVLEKAVMRLDRAMDDIDTNTEDL